MSLLSFQQRMIKKISPRAFTMVFLGKIIFWFGIGAWFSEKLLKYQQMLFFLGTVGVLYYLLNNFLEWRAGKEIRYLNHFLGAFCGFLLVVAMGASSAELKSAWFFVIGALLLLPALWQMVK